MAGDGFTKRDWTLFREKVPGWQEAYMDKLNKEYIELLSRDANPSEKFWKHILSLIQDGAIRFEDLEEFSDGLKERIAFILNA